MQFILIDAIQVLLLAITHASEESFDCRNEYYVAVDEDDRTTRDTQESAAMAMARLAGQRVDFAPNATASSIAEKLTALFEEAARS